MDYSVLEDIELIKILDEAVFAKKILDSEEWKMLEEFGKRVVDNAVELLLKTASDDVSAISDIKAIIIKYKHGVFEEIRQMVEEGEIRFEEARDAGTLERLNKDGDLQM